MSDRIDDLDPATWTGPRRAAYEEFVRESIRLARLRGPNEPGVRDDVPSLIRRLVRPAERVRFAQICDQSAAAAETEGGAEIYREAARWCRDEANWSDEQ